MTNEELAQSLESIMIGPLCLAPLTNAEYNACSDALTEATASLRELAMDGGDWIGRTGIWRIGSKLSPDALNINTNCGGSTRQEPIIPFARTPSAPPSTRPWRRRDE